MSLFNVVLPTTTTRKSLEMFCICNNHSATLVMKLDVESYVKLMSLRSRRASLMSPDLIHLVQFFLFKNARVDWAQSLAVTFFVAFFTSNCEHCTMFFPVAFFVLHVFIWQIMYMFSWSTNLNSLTEMVSLHSGQKFWSLILSRGRVTSHPLWIRWWESYLTRCYLNNFWC